MFTVLYTIRGNKDNNRDHIDQMKKDKYKKVTFHYHPAARKDLGRPQKLAAKLYKMLDGLSHDRKMKSKWIIKMTCKFINKFV